MKKNITFYIIFSLLQLTLQIIVNSKAIAQQNDYLFLNTELPLEKRVEDLVNRLTLEEKVSQMMNASPAIERLGIPEYNWWSEGLHGVARAGLATVFPQAIGLAATWDEDLMFRVANIISDEARAKHHNFERNGKRFIYQGLTFWSPNINIFRDPRWGRGQETYGEDPFLTGRLGVQFVKGMQGNNPDYFKTIATVKHFVVHSGPEPERHSFDAVTNSKDFLDFYLPQFEMGIKEGKAYSLMCAYNRYNGEACCGSNFLLNDLLRNDWGFEGFVVSDCGAIRDIHQFHKIVQTPEEAAALAVKSGTDLNCGIVYQNLTEAVKKGLISEEEIDIAVKRLFTARFRLGMFDPPEMVEYTKIPYNVIDSEDHKKLALEATHKSIVLLKNDNLLPLKKDIKNVAVIGPNSDQWLMLLGNYNGVPSDPVTPLRGIKEKLPDAKIIYAQGCELAEGMPIFELVPHEVLFSDENKNGLKVEYFNSRDFTSQPLSISSDKVIDANWFDKAPREDMNDDDFAVRWNGYLQPEISGEYQLGLISTCKVRVFFNDNLITKSTYHQRDEFGDPRLIKSPMLQLKAGEKYKILVEAEESYADAQVQFVWAKPKPNLKKEALDAAKEADVVIMFMGLTPRMEGEEMDIQIEGFRGGDRTDLNLPDVQQELIKEIHSLGKPVVLVLLNGSALALNWEDENIPAIVEAWYPGQAAGTAIADVLFGDYNPAGRLPVTFYKSINDLPPFEQYEITNQTYRYFTGEPLYPFGYGLSYTTFRYENLRINYENKIGDTVEVSVDIKNIGDMEGDEVVQLYISKPDAPFKAPLRLLKGFKRIHLKPGETQDVKLKLPPEAFTLIDDNAQKIILEGEYEISIGGGQPDSRGTETGINLLKTNINLIKN